MSHALPNPVMQSVCSAGCAQMVRVARTLVAAVFVIAFISSHVKAQGWQWARSGTNVHCDAWAIAADASGNVYGAGEDLDFGFGAITFGTIVDSVWPQQAIWVKYSPSGTPLWSGYTTGDGFWLNNICTDPSGNLIVYGVMDYFSVKIGSVELTDTPAWTNAGAHKYVIAKISPSGTLLWAINDGINVNLHTILTLPDNPPILSDGGITTDKFGNIYITGGFHDSLILGGHTFYSAGGTDAFVAKYSPSGALIWANAIGGAGNDYGRGITVSSTGSVYICGYMDSVSFSVGPSTLVNLYAKPLAYIAEFSSSGTPLWGQLAGGRNGSYAVGLQSDNYGNVYMTGGFEDTTISFGVTTVTRTYPLAVPHLALYLVQYSDTHTVTWYKTIGSRHAGVWGYSIAMAACGQVWVTGDYTDTATIDTATLLPQGTMWTVDPMLIAGYDLSGGLIGYSGLRTGGDDQNGIACDAAGNLYVCSDIGSYIVAGPDSIVGTGIGENIFVAKYKNTSVIPDTTYQRHDTSICSSGADSIKITAPPGYTTYYWNDLATDSFHTFRTAGTYWVYCLTCGEPVLIDTFVLSDTGIADTATARHDTTFCQFSDIPVPITLIADTGGHHYLWYNGDTTLFDTISHDGTYWVSYAAHCVLHIDTFVATTIPQPAPITGHDTVCVGDNITLADAMPGGIWSSSNTAVAAIDSSSGVITGISPGTDTITYSIPNGCFASRSEIVLAPPCYNAVPTVPALPYKVDIFPVPASNELIVKMASVSFSSLTITDVVGQPMLTQEIHNATTAIRIDGLPPGIYYITFWGEAGVLTRRFIKE